MKISAFVVCLMLFSSSVGLSQEVAEVNQKVDKDLIANYFVLKAKPDIKMGRYLLHTRRKNMAVALGQYTDNKKTGTWRYFDGKGKVIQVFDYDANKLMYEAPEEPGEGFNYLFDVVYKNTDTLTKPIKIGGRYYGYRQFAQLFVCPQWFKEIPGKNVSIELLISPFGRLAEFNFRLSFSTWDGNALGQQEEVLRVNLNTLSDDDKFFIPATKNSEPVSSRIVIRARITGNNRLLILE